MITGFGTATQQEKRMTVRLDTRKLTLDVGSFKIAGGKEARAGE